MPVPDDMALVMLYGTPDAATGALSDLVNAFRAAALPIVHVVDTGPAVDAGYDLDLDLLGAGGVQTVGPAEMAIALANRGAFDATPLDALLRGLGVDTVVIGGPVPSPVVSASVEGAELRGYRVMLATDELAVTLGAYLRAA
jgi:nicotinamidase-related amidase